MTKQALVKIGVTGIAVCISTAVSANGLLGKHYLGASMTSQNWGDNYSLVEDLAGRTYGTTIIGNYNLTENWDFNASYEGLWDSSTTLTNKVDGEQHTFMAGLNYLLPCDSSPITPYVGGSAGQARAKADYGPSSETERAAAFEARLGAEWDACEDAFLNCGLVYTYVDSDLLENKGNYGIDIATGVQIIDHLLLAGNVTYIFEDDAATFSVGLVIVQ